MCLGVGYRAKRFVWIRASRQLGIVGRFHVLHLLRSFLFSSSVELLNQSVVNYLKPISALIDPL